MSFFNKMFSPGEEGQPPSNVAWRQLTDLGQLNEMNAESTAKPIIVFKHSTHCGVSRMVLKQFEKNYDLQDAVTPYFIDILEYRTLSNAISEYFKVGHESPQLLLLINGTVVYNASHGDITVADLKQYI